MTYTLDTNAIAAILRDDGRLVGRVAEAPNRGDAVTLNALSYFEAKRGLSLPTFRRKLDRFEAFANLFGMLPLDVVALDISAGIYQDLRRKGTPLEDADILIAGTTLAHDATLVTRNLKHFERVEGLRLESWEAAAV